jgi:predicted nucleic acid-binding protein
MKKVVFDTSVAIKWFFPESGKDKSAKLKDRYAVGEIRLCTCDLFLYEFTSCLRNYTSMKIKEDDFSLATRGIQSLGLEIYPLDYSELPGLFALSRKLELSVYDCAYLLLAKTLKAPLYTADRKLYLKAKKLVVSILV